METNVYFDILATWAPRLVGVLRESSESTCRRAALAGVEYALANAAFSDGPVARIACLLKDGVLPEENLRRECVVAVDTLDREYQDVFEEFEGDRSLAAPWREPFVRFLAANVVLLASERDACGAAAKSLYHAFAIEQNRESIGLEDQILNAVLIDRG